MATVQKRGKSYRVQIRKQGHAPIIKSFKLKRDAIEYARVTEGKLASGDLAVPGKHTLGDAIDAYIEANQLSKYDLSVLDWWRKELGKERLAMIRATTFKSKRKLLQKLPISIATVNRRMSRISAVITLAMDEGWVATNPARIPSLSEKESARVRLLDSKEQAALITACEASDEPCMVDFVISALGTGARAGELQALTWADVDMDRGLAILQTTKNKDKRGLPIRGKVLEVFKRRKKLWAEKRLSGDFEHDFVFWNKTGFAPFYYRKDWAEARKASGINDFMFHDLRHCAASHLAMAGVSLREIAEILGHRQLQMVMRYSHLYDEHVGALGDTLDKALWGES